MKNSKREQQRKMAFNYCYRLRSKATWPEKKVKKLLRSMDINFKFQWIFFDKDRFFITDFFLPDYRVVLEIDGKKHKEKDQIIYDKYRTDFLIKKCKINEVLRFNNSDVMNNTGIVEDQLFDRFCEIKKDPLSIAFFETIK